jgi:hypothetical protein
VVTDNESAIKNKEIALGAFLNIGETFNRTLFDVIKQATEKHGIKTIICRWICSLLESGSIITTLQEKPLCARVSMARGQPQPHGVKIGTVGGGVQLDPLGIAATNRPIVPPHCVITQEQN